MATVTLITDEEASPEVRAVFDAYVAELRRTFDAHAPTCLPHDVAARGLRVVEL